MVEQAETMESINFKMLADKIDKLFDYVQTLQVSLARLEASMMPRPEIVTEIEKKVSIAAYLSDQDSIKDRLAKLENTPADTRAWLNTWIAGAGCLLSTLLAGGSLTVSLLMLAHVIGGK